jgi:hypothetical protein
MSPDRLPIPVRAGTALFFIVDGLMMLVDLPVNRIFKRDGTTDIIIG